MASSNLQLSTNNTRSPNGIVLPSNLGSSIQKLNGANYLPWKRQVMIILKLRGLEKAIALDNVEENIDLQAILLLLESMDDAHKMQVQAEPTARAIMSNLERQYANRSEANKLRLLSSFMRHEKLPSDTLNQHVGRLKEMRAALANLGEEYTEDFFQVVIINSLTAEYGNFLEKWEVIHPSMKSTDFLLNILQQKEQSMKDEMKNDTNKVVFLTHQKQNKEWEGLSIEERKKISKCGICKKFGHWFRECPDAPKQDEQPPKYKSSGHVKPKVNVVLNLGNIDPSLKTKWILDSGATQHMCNTKTWFTELQLYPSPHKATVGDGKLIEVWGTGTIKFVYRTVEAEVEGTLTNVNYIPDLATNLVSVSAAADKGIEAVFGGKECCLKKGASVVMSGPLENNLYVLNIKAIAPEKVLLIQAVRSADEWHKVLGHPSEARLATMLKDEATEIKATGHLSPCAECPAAKAQHAQHPARNLEDTDVGQRVHLDLGFITNKDKTYNYYMLSKDEASEFCFIHFIDRKSEVNLALADLIIQFEHGCGRPIKSVMSDNGSEFVNKTNQLLFLKEGILHETSAPYIAQQNGMIEREMRTINSMARALLCQSTLGMEVAKEALRTACYLKNRLPTSKNALSPFERFMGRKPYLLNLVKFGTEVQILDNVNRNSKFDAKTVPGYVVGFTNRRNTYRVYVPSYLRTIETCDIYFSPHIDKKETAAESSKLDEIRVQLGSHLNIDNSHENKIVNHSPHSEQKLDTGVTDNNNFETAQYDLPLTSTVRHRSRVNGKPYITGEDLDEFFNEVRCQQPSEEEAEGDTTGELSNGCELTYEEECSEDSEPPTPPPRFSSTFFIQKGSLDEPQTYAEAVDGPNSVNWQAAIIEELDAHNENSTWEIVDRPKSGIALTAKWVFVIKRNTEGDIDRFKARLVARGFQQRYGRDYSEIFAPVARLETIRVMLALIAVRKFAYVQFDVSTAFLHGQVEEEIFLEAPDGVKIADGKCLKLKKALYGLKQAPRAWNLRLDQALKACHLEPTVSDPCVYTNKCGTLYVIVYVDDGLVIGDHKEKCLEIIATLQKQFKLKLLSGSLFVGMEISRLENGDLCVSQRRYIKDIAARFNMSAAKPARSPTIDVKYLVTDQESELTSAPYREAVGCLMYLANCTRPDILFTVNYLSRFNDKATNTHWQAVKHIIRYLISSLDYILRYQVDEGLVKAYSDADWAGQLSQRYSTSGCIIFLGGGPIVFASRKQTTLALSSTEAEYISASEAAKELMWVENLLLELKFSHETPRLYIDNLSTINQIKNNDTKRRSKHVELRYHFVRHQYKNKLFKLEAIKTEDQPADILTKPLSGQKIKQLIENCHIFEVNMAQRRPLQNKNHMALIAMTICMIMNMGQVVNGIHFERTNYHVLRETSHRVNIGTHILLLNYKPIAPCSLVSTHDDNGVKGTVYEGLQSECESKYRSVMGPALEEFANCYRHSRKRSKREMVSLGMFVFGIVYAVGWLGTMLYSYISPGSSYNRLNEAEIREKTQDTKLIELEHKLMGAKNMRDELISADENLAQGIATNKVSIGQLAQIIPAVSMTTFDMRYDMNREAELLKRISRECKKERASPEDYYELFKIEAMKDLYIEDTYLESVRRSENGTFIVDLMMAMYANDATIYQVAPFRHWQNVTTEPILTRYVGPEFVLVNKTNNCLKGIEDPRKIPFYGTCDEGDYRDPRVDLWEKIEEDNSEFTKLSRPQVIKTRYENLIYCLYFQIDIGQHTYECPPFAFSLPRETQFGLVNQKHLVRVDYKYIEDRATPHRTIELKVENQDPQYGQLIRALREKNAQSLDAGRFGFNKSTLTIPIDISTLLSCISVFAAVVTIISCCWTGLKKACCIQATSSQGTPQGSDHINIITVPQSSGQTSPDMNSRIQYESVVSPTFDYPTLGTMSPTLASDINHCRRTIPHNITRPAPPPPCLPYDQPTV